jgi:hypothetical protein
MKIRITGLPDKLMFEEGGKQPPKKPKNKVIRKPGEAVKEVKVADNKTYQYDRNGNLVGYIEKSKMGNYRYYDNKDKMYKIVFTDGKIHHYDKNSTNTTKIEYPNGDVETYNNDGSSQVVDSNGAIHFYDKDNNNYKRQNPDKSVSTFEKDTNNKTITIVTYPDGKVEKYKDNVLIDNKTSTTVKKETPKSNLNQKETKDVVTNNQTQMPDPNKKTSKGVSPQDIVDAITPNPYEQIKPYEGDKYGTRKKGTPESNASVHSKEEWQKIAEKVGFKGGDNKAFQKYLLESKDPKIVEAIKKLHEKHGDPKSGKNWEDGFLGYRWDAVFDDLNANTPTEEKKLVVPAPNVQETSTDPLNYDIPVDNFQKDPYNRRKLPFYQIAPDLANFAAANDMYNYWTPDYTHQEIQPPTLNIQDQLNSMDSSMNAVLATTTGDPNIDQARKQAVMNQILQAKDSAYARKQNYDAEGRFKADEFNIGARNKEMVDDINAASTIHNEYVAEAKDNMTYEKMASIQNMYRKYMTNEATENKYEMMSQMFNNVGYDAKTGKMKISSNPNDINAIREQRMKEAQSKPRVQSKVKTEPTSTFGGRRNLPFLDPNVYDNIDTGLDFENRLDLNYESNANIA